MFFLIIRLLRKKKRDSKSNLNEKVNFNYKSCGDVLPIESDFNNEKLKLIDTCDESTMNNLDEIQDEKSSNSSIVVTKRGQIGFDIFESTLKQINKVNENLDDPALAVKQKQYFNITDAKSINNNNEASVFMRKFKNSLLTGYKPQNQSAMHFRNINNSNNSNYDKLYYKNNFEQDFKKERFLSNTKLNTPSHLLGLVAQQQALKNRHKILNSNSQISTTTFFSSSDISQNIKN